MWLGYVAPGLAGNIPRPSLSVLAAVARAHIAPGLAGNIPRPSLSEERTPTNG